MKAAEISGGVSATLRVRSTNRAFPSLPSREQEVVLLRSGDQTLLCYGDVVEAIEGVTPADATQVIDIVTSGLPVIAYVAQANTTALVIETRRFTQELRVTDAMQFGLDDKVMDDVRKQHRIGGTAQDVGGWLEDRLLMPPAPGEPEHLRRVVISGDVRGRLDAFRIHGLKIAADIRRFDNKLRIERVVRGGKSNQPRLMLLFAPITIVDATQAAELHSTVRTTLAEAVTSSSSYLRTWQEYQMLSDNYISPATTTTSPHP